MDEKIADKVVLPSLRYSYERQSDVAFLLNTLGQLWLSGVQINWSGFYTHEHRLRLPLPTYPFERQAYWIDPPQSLQLKTTPSTLWNSLVDAGHNQANIGKSAFDEQTYQEQKQSMDRLCTAYINQTVRNLGAFHDPSEKYSFEELLKKCQIIPYYRQLWWRWLQILVEQGHLQQDEDESYANLLQLSSESIDALLEEVKVKWSDAPETVDILKYCGENLTTVLTGQKQALEFHVAKFAEEDEVPIQNLPSIGYYKTIMQAAVERLAKSLPADVKLKIIEIGGGQGIATDDMLTVLPAERTEYLFTDVGGWFLNTAKEKYKNYPFVEYGFLDIEKPLSEQGYSEHSFDVVIAVNVLHVVRNVGEALENVRSLLAPGGLLLMWEITQPQLLFDVADGLLMNPVEDAGRNQGNPFLSEQEWEQALRSHGFSQVATFSEIDGFGQHVLLAQTAPIDSPSISAAFTTPSEQQNLEQTPQILFGKKPDLRDWFYIPSWKRSVLPARKSQEEPSGCYLVFVDECGLGSQMVRQLQLAGEEIITVKAGDRFASENQSYRINSQEASDYDRLLRELRALNLTPKQIIHFWSVTPATADANGNLGFHSLLFLAQALGEQNLTAPIEIGIVSNNMQAVTGSENLSPEKALILGPCKVVPLEYSNITCRSVDVVIPESNTWEEEELVNQLLTEFTTPTSEQIVAYRGVHRWTQTFEPVHLESTIEKQSSLREEGVYLITGGLGGVGFTLAEYLARTLKARLILTGRSTFPAKQEWSQWLSQHDEQDEISQKIRRILALEALGAEVLVISADVTDSQQMSAAIAQANRTFGQIHGVIHAAFIPRGSMIQRRTKETPGADIGPKVKGTRVLVNLFQDIKLDFFLLFSSIYAFEPLAGQVDYVAESAFLDAFAHESISRKHNTFIRSINWDGWSGIGAAVSFTVKYKEITGKDIRDGMTASEGIEAFTRILESPKLPQIVVSTHDLLTLLTKVKENLSFEAIQKADASKPIRQRPELKNAYVAPSNEVEFKIAESFQKFLGFELLGIHDNFFALGGDSLTGSVLIKQLSENFQIELPLRLLYEAPTIAELAIVIEKILIEELEELTEEEANLILEKNN